MAQVIQPNQRRNYRRSLPQLVVRLDNGGSFLSRDWSLGGIALFGHRQQTVGTGIEGLLRLAQSNESWCPFAGNVVRTDSKLGMMAIAFSDLPADTFRRLEELLKRPAPQE